MYGTINRGKGKGICIKESGTPPPGICDENEYVYILNLIYFLIEERVDIYGIYWNPTCIMNFLFY